MKGKQPNYATGHTPTALPCYNELDDQGFERFCTDLLNLHPEIHCRMHGKWTTRKITHATQLLSGTSQKGGDIRADDDHGGVWFIQCKHVQKFGPSQVSKAIELAEDKFPQADQYVLITTSGLSEQSQGRLYDRPNWLWWDSSKLNNLVFRSRPRENAINLVHQHFGPDITKKLLPCSDQLLLTWQQYFAQDLSEPRTYFHHRVPYIDVGDSLTPLQTFARKGAGRALVLSAPGGQGKSRLLLELARRAEDQPNFPRVRFLNLDRRGLTYDKHEFLAREEEDLLLIVEDAHRMDAAIEDVARAASKAKSIRLLVATRPQGLASVSSQLYQHGYEEKLKKPLVVPGWNEKSMHELAERVLDPPHRFSADRLVKLADRCPLLVVMGGVHINTNNWPEAITDEESFRERVFRSFKEDFLRLQPESRRDGLDRLIQFLAFISPTPLNENLLHQAAAILDCNPMDVDDDLGALQVAGLIVENREGIRLYPDLFADAVLFDACLDHRGRPSLLHHTLLDRLPLTDFPAVMRNVAQADWWSRSRGTETGALFDPIWKEFLRRFEEAKWPSQGDFLQNAILQLYRGDPQGKGPDRGELVSQWATFAAFLPEKTLHLAELAIRCGEDSMGDPETGLETKNHIRNVISHSLPSLLKPIVIWHPDQADRALDILWSLDCEEPQEHWPSDSNSIGAIADAASYAIEKPLITSNRVLRWLEDKIKEPGFEERLTNQPWCLSALLKPFFIKSVEHAWSSKDQLHMSTWPVDPAKTRPLWQRALAIAETFLGSEDPKCQSAVIPVIQEAMQPSRRKSDDKRSSPHDDPWRQCRLQVLSVVESTLQSPSVSPALMLRFRTILHNRRQHDPDNAIRNECQRILEAMPDTLELRVMKVLTSWAHDEYRIRPDPHYKSDSIIAEQTWDEFRKSVAHETLDTFKSAKKICDFIRQTIQELQTMNLTIIGYGFLAEIVDQSPGLCTDMLDAVTDDPGMFLVGFLGPLLDRSATHAPSAYEKTIKKLAKDGLPDQQYSLVHYLGWKARRTKELSNSERASILRLTQATEETVTIALASETDTFVGVDTALATQILGYLVPKTERAGSALLHALGNLVKENKGVLSPSFVRQCLGKIGFFAFPRSDVDELYTEAIGDRFPKELYSHATSLLGKIEDTRMAHRLWQGETVIPLGTIQDKAFLDHEIRVQWSAVNANECSSFERELRLVLLRSLIRSDSSNGWDRVRRLVSDCRTGEELKLAANIAAPQGTRFVFDFPDIARELLSRGEELKVDKDIRTVLYLSACGGGRTFSGNNLDPEYHYILEQAESLANRFRDDELLAPLYRDIAASERSDRDDYRRSLPDEEG